MKAVPAPFRFRQFTLHHHQSTMKAGTDAMLLGSWLPLTGQEQRVLDVGTGSGIVALMLAQRSQAFIHAIDIHQASVQEAAQNFQNSPWSNRLNAEFISFQKFALQQSRHYDLIVSNPPFFHNSLLPSDERLKMAKHNLNLSIADFINSSLLLLAPQGRLAVIMPIPEAADFCAGAEAKGLFMQHQLFVMPTPEHPPSRRILLLARQPADKINTQHLTVRQTNGKYTEEYISLTRDFHPEGYL
jgi:tRNA1Val (adenine37-N6)-methyltransferase